MKLAPSQTPPAPESSRGHRRGPQARTIGAAGTALALAAALMATNTPAQGLNSNRTGEPDDRGFPSHYTDDAGISLTLCEDGTAACLGAVRDDLTPPEGEALYWAATATVPTSRGDLDVEFALEAAFGDAGEPIVLDRIRIRGHLARAGRHVLHHPYGSTRFRAASPREQRNVNLTEDLDCSLRRGGPCAGHITNFLRSTRAPRGYVGGGEVATRVTGGTVRNRLVVRARRGGVIGSTRRLAVLGKLAPGPQAALSSTSVNFGNTATRRERSVVVRNIGDARLSFGRIQVLGSDAIRRTRETSCRGGLAPRRACRVTLAYRPGARRVAHARLVIGDNTIARVHRVRLRAGTASVLSMRRRVHFASRNVGSQSRSRRVVVQNRGVVPMRIKRMSISGGDARSFERRSGVGPLCVRGMALRPGGVCAVYVAFAPRTFGTKSSNLTVRSTAVNSPRQVRLTGRGR